MPDLPPLRLSLEPREPLVVEGAGVDDMGWHLKWWSPEREEDFHILGPAPEAYFHLVGSALRELPEFRRAVEWEVLNAEGTLFIDWPLHTLALFDEERATRAREALGARTTFAEFRETADSA